MFVVIVWSNASGTKIAHRRFKTEAEKNDYIEAISEEDVSFEYYYERQAVH